MLIKTLLGNIQRNERGNSLAYANCLLCRVFRFRRLKRIATRGCKFLVFGRDMGTGFVRLADLDLPDVLRNISREVPPEVFRENVSSTGLRKAGAW
ncbi:MAG: hypothetical protein IT426_05045 [Pirellulales bacterium]|nr:hypothetical protein [Pirellulales bacterium]